MSKRAGWYNRDTGYREATATMLTKLTVRNFKQFEEVTVELDNVVVFVGPNDSGKNDRATGPVSMGVGLAEVARVPRNDTYQAL